MLPFRRRDEASDGSLDDDGPLKPDEDDFLSFEEDPQGSGDVDSHSIDGLDLFLLVGKLLVGSTATYKEE
jgi:hypothetical protein